MLNAMEEWLKGRRPNNDILENALNSISVSPTTTSSAVCKMKFVVLPPWFVFSENY